MLPESAEHQAEPVVTAFARSDSSVACASTLEGSPGMFRNISVHASILFVLLFLPVSLTLLTAQTDSGIVSGLAVDQSGALVSDATVKLINTGTNAERTGNTNTSGC